MADGGEVGGRRVGESLFTPELGQVICARVASGESLMEVAQETHMPHRTTIRNWARADPQFAGELGGAMRAARFERRRLDREIAAAKRARPKPARGGKVSTYSRAVGEAVCERLANGESLIAIGRDPAMPCPGTVYGWIKRHPEFEELYVQARGVQADYLFDEAREVALAATPKTVWVGRLQFDVIRWQTARMAPRKYCERLVIAQGAQEMALEAAEAAGGGAGMTVIVKRFSDVTPEEEAEADAYEARLARGGR